MKKIQIIKSKKSVKNVVPQKKSTIRSKSPGGTTSVKNVATRTKVGCVQCLQCGDTIYSCAGHDFRECSCGNVFIDGGFNYCRVGGDANKIKMGIIKYIPATKQQLYDDWNMSNTKPRKYGCIKPKSSWKSPLSQLSSACLDSTTTN